MARKRNTKFTIWRTTKSGGRVGTAAFRNNRTGSFRTGSRFTATFEPDEDWDVFVDSRHLNRRIGVRLKRHFVASIQADRHPETGQANPATYQTSTGRWRERTQNRDFRSQMANSLNRTITASEASWGGGGKRISLARTRMKFYFPDPKLAAVNSFESTRKSNRAFYLGLGGKVRPMIDQEVGEWMDLVLEGHEFKEDTKASAWGR